MNKISVNDVIGKDVVMTHPNGGEVVLRSCFVLPRTRTVVGHVDGEYGNIIALGFTDLPYVHKATFRLLDGTAPSPELMPCDHCTNRGEDWEMYYPGDGTVECDSCHTNNVAQRA